MKKRIAAILITLVLLLGVLPLNVFAQENPEEVLFSAEMQFSASVLSDADSASKLGLTKANFLQLKADVEDALYRGAEEVDISKYKISANQTNMRYLMDLVLDQIPEFLLPGANFRQNSSYKFSHIVFKYDHPTEGTKYNNYYPMLEDCYAYSNTLLIGIIDSPTLTDEEKLLLLHDRIATHIDYDYEALLKEQEYGISMPWADHCMYGPLTTGIGVCDGYSKVYQFMLKRLGIECYVIRSTDLYHAWNVVTLDGKQYYVDITWDDPVWDVTGQVLHDNFLISASKLWETGHKAYDYDRSLNNTKYDNYYWKNSNTSFQLVDDEIYFIDATNQTLYHRDGNTNRALISVRDTWYDSYYRYNLYNCARLAADADLLFISQSKNVLSYNPETGEKKVFFTPANNLLNQGYSIFGFEARWDKFYYEYSTTSVYTASTKNNYSYYYKYRTTAVPAYLRVKTPLNKNTYYLNSTFDFSGLTLTVIYSDLSTKNVTTTTGFSLQKTPTTLGEQYVNIMYGGQKLKTKIIVYNSGDANSDGIVNTTDLALLKKKVAGLGGSVSNKCDMDGNGSYATTDLAILKKRIAGF